MIFGARQRAVNAISAGWRSMSREYRIYGSLESREAVALSSVLIAKGLSAKWIEPSAVLVLDLESRSGRATGPYLRAPDGFLLGDLHAILNWIEVAHPVPALLPETPVRHVCARMLEDWIDCWLPDWPRRSWRTLETIGAHLSTAGFLLGTSPTRPDWLLAAWLETEVLNRIDARRHLERIAPRLVSLGDDLLAAPLKPQDDDAVPISLLPLLEEMGDDYHAFLSLNQGALKDRSPTLRMDLGLGKRTLRVSEDSERRRVEIAEWIRARPEGDRRSIRRLLEGVGAWHALTLPALPDPIDPADPRSL